MNNKKKKNIYNVLVQVLVLYQHNSVGVGELVQYWVHLSAHIHEYTYVQYALSHTGMFK